MLDYVPALSAVGFDVEVAHFFDESYLQGLYAGERSVLATLMPVLSRVQRLIFSTRPDIIWIEKEAFPWLPWTIEKFLLPKNIPIVSDYDDAVYHRYDLHTSSIIKFAMGKKIDSLMAASELVMAGNLYLASRAKSAGDQRVDVVPTVINIENYSIDRNQSCDGRSRIGWIGSPSTWGAYCEPLLPVLISCARKHDAMVRAVGVPATVSPSETLETLPWSEDTEVRCIQGMDIGVMPLDDSPWARGKCGYKLLQYMACGLPVVASPVGVNSQIVEHGVNGFLAETDAEWAAALDTLIGDPALRRQMGMAGRKKVEREYSLQVYGPKIANNLMNIAIYGRNNH
jgi:glycosyltransferase involved in cell wall biosynthesis